MFDKQSKAVFAYSSEIVTALTRLIEQGQAAGELLREIRGYRLVVLLIRQGLGMINHDADDNLVREFVDRGCRIIGLLRRG
ncbi:hypothetical protein [Cohnella faecalis]|uniref:Uncharacterized protein n=1 Tax=Cohnella faecalis TaxID=2315694 RepID=A0A398D2V1_9BACL|nr:hypothetical protein [Cohnella faecalis]RIE05414.1 hypothetical protein D3H35_00565 [Cohnella faecalis]